MGHLELELSLRSIRSGQPPTHAFLYQDAENQLRPLHPATFGFYSGVASCRPVAPRTVGCLLIQEPGSGVGKLWTHITEARAYLKEFIQRHRELHS